MHKKDDDDEEEEELKIKGINIQKNREVKLLKTIVMKNQLIY